MRSRQDLRFLIEGLRSISANGKQVSLAVIMQGSPSPIGLDKVMNTVDDGYHRVFEDYIKLETKSTIEGLKIRAVTLDTPDDEACVDIRETDPALFSCLKDIDLEFEPITLHHSMQSLQRMLSTTENLTKFSLNSNIISEGEVLLDDATNVAQILQVTKSKVLREVCLEDVATFAETLIEFLKMPMLRTLKLRGVVIQGSWIDTLAWIRDHTSLTSFELHQGFTIGFAGYGRDEPTMWYADKIEFRGPVEVRAGLDKFIEERKKKQEEQEANGSANGNNSLEDE